LLFPGYRALSHLRREEWNLRAANETSDTRGAPRVRDAAAPSMIKGRFALRIISAARFQRGTMGDRNLNRVLPHHGYIFGFLTGDVLRQFQQNRARPLFHSRFEMRLEPVSGCCWY